VNESYRKYRDAYAEDWVVRAYELAPPDFARLLAAEAAWIRARAALPLLEIGCGAGRLLLAAGLDRAGAVGFDLVLRYLAAARGRLARTRLVNGDAFRPPFAAASFATVVLAQATIGSVGGAELRRRMTAAAGRLVRPGGCLLVTAYGSGAREARRAWYVAQQAAGLLPPFDPDRTRDGRFVFANGFVSEELAAPALKRLRPAGFGGGVEELPGGMVAAAWSRLTA